MSIAEIDPAAMAPVGTPATVELVARPSSRLLDRLRHDPWYTMVTLLIDVETASLAVGIAYAWGAGTQAQAHVGWLPVLFIPFVLALLATRGAYRHSLTRRFLDEVGPLMSAIGLAVILLLAVLLVVDSQGRPGELVIKIWVCAVVLMPLARLLRTLGHRFARRKYDFAAPTLLIGDGPVAHQLLTRMTQMPEYGLRAVGLLDVTPPASAKRGDMGTGVPYLGSPSDFRDVALTTAAEELVISACALPDEEVVAVVRTAHRLGIRVWVIPRAFDAVGAHARVEHLGGLPLMVLPRVNPDSWQFKFKHAAGRTIAAVGLLIISPIFLTLAALVRLSSPGPIFFAQKRVGRDGKPFDCLKFRSMRPPRDSDADFELRSGDAPGGVEGIDRRTRIGKFMRQTSLDELPQLINVLRGDMALVGPRPERPEYVALFDMQIRRYGERHRVKAGLTGWAQVHGLRGQTSIADRAEWDNYYIENWSLARIFHGMLRVAGCR